MNEKTKNGPNQKEYYDNLFSDDEDTNWEAAPGKQVIMSAIQNYYANGKILDKSKILDIGCGSGFFLNRIYHEVTTLFSLVGVDFSSTAINKAKERYPELQFYCEDGGQHTLITMNLMS